MTPPHSLIPHTRTPDGLFDGDRAVVGRSLEDGCLRRRVCSVFGTSAQDLPDALAAHHDSWVGRCCLVEESPRRRGNAALCGGHRRDGALSLPPCRCRICSLTRPQPTPHTLLYVLGYLTATLLVLDVRIPLLLLPFALLGTCNPHLSTQRPIDAGTRPEIPGIPVGTASGKFTLIPHNPGTVSQPRSRLAS